jgi:diguanylate cyclase (GGDEF)-like protein
LVATVDHTALSSETALSPELLYLLLTLVLGLAIGFYAGQKSRRPVAPDRKAGEQVVPARTAQPVKGEPELASQLATRTREVEALKAKLAASERVEKDLALTDPLTGIGNHMLLSDRVEHAIVRARRHNARLGILMLDLDNFAAINEKLGRPGGDRILIDIARKLREAVRAEDTVAHVRGDRFAIALEGVFEREDVDRARETVLRAFAEPFEIDGTEVEVKARVASALFPVDGESAEALMRTTEQQLSVGRTRRRKAATKQAS